MKKRIYLKESQLRQIIKESVKKVLKEVRGWSAEPEDFVIVGGKLDPNKQYYYIGISMSNGLMAKYITPYKEYFPDMLNDIKEWDERDGDPDKNMFISMDEYYHEVRETMKEDGCDEERAHESLGDIYLPVDDYGFCIYAPYGMNDDGPFSGKKVQDMLNSLPDRSLM